MTSKLERKWWFLLPTSTVTSIATAYLMDSVGVHYPYTIATWLLYILCFSGLQRAFSFAAWLLVLALSPSDRALARTR